MDQRTARALIAGAHAHAGENGWRVTAAVVDAGGLLVALERMDGAFPLSAQIAESKAQGAAVWHRDGHVIAEDQSERPAFVAALSELSRLPIIPGAGSLVVRDDAGAVLGAIGVSGARADEDRACAEAALAALAALSRA